MSEGAPLLVLPQKCPLRRYASNKLQLFMKYDNIEAARQVRLRTTSSQGALPSEQSFCALFEYVLSTLKMVDFVNDIVGTLNRSFIIAVSKDLQ